MTPSDHLLMRAQVEAELRLAPARIILELMPMSVTPPQPGFYLCRQQVDGYEPRWNVIRWDGEQWLCGGYVRMLSWAGPLL